MKEGNKISDLDSLISGKDTSGYRVQPIEVRKAKIVGKNCRKCEEYFQQDHFLRSNSWFFPDGYIEICNECLMKYLGDCSDLQKADKFCQYADIPFNVNDWMAAVRNHNNYAFKYYAEQIWTNKYETINWKSVHDEWVDIVKNGEERENIDVLRAEDLKDLKKKWGDGFTEEQLIRFEELYKDIDKTQSIITAIQRDNARKMCMLSYQIEQAIWSEDTKGTDVKALIGAYDQLSKSSDFTPKSAKNAGDFDSVGELCAFLEQRGFKNKFYDWVPRDEVDKVMLNLQKYTKRIVLGETNIAEELNEKLEAVQNMNRLEYGDEDFDDEEFNKVVIDDSLADEYNEEFEVDE